MNRLNNRGQTLIMFVILVPVILMLMALIIDTAYLYRENAKLESTTKSIIKNLYDSKEDDNINRMIINLYKENDIQTKNLEIISNTTSLKIINHYKVDSIFGKIIGLKQYEVKVSLKGYYDGNKLRVIKE